VPEDTPKSSAGGGIGLARSLVPSLVILGGVFFFINSACLNEEDDDGSYYTPPFCAFDDDVATPPGASVTIVEPTADRVYVEGVDGLVRVPVRMTAQGIEITGSAACRANTGHFFLSVERTAGEGCVDPLLLGPIALTDGAEEFELMLPAGSYLLTVRVDNSGELAYAPAVQARVRFTTEGPPPSFDGGVCP
jgi:hypothetical protein